MSIKNIGTNKWGVCVDIGRNPKSGRRKQVRKIVNGSKKDAQDFEVQTRRDAHKLVRTDRTMTVGGFLNDVWLPSLDVSEPTRFEYQKYTTWTVERLGAVNLHELTPYQIETTLDELKAVGTRRNTHRTLRIALNYAVRMQFIPTNPILLLKMSKAPSTADTKVYTPEQAQGLLSLFHGSDIEAGVILMLYGGLRASEACAIEWDDLKP